MSAYLDATVLCSVLLTDAHQPKVIQWLAKRPKVTYSAWTVTETSSAFSQQVRMKALTSGDRDQAEAQLDLWIAKREPPLAVLDDDFLAARSLLLSHKLLRAPDALHLAIAQRMKLSMATFDDRLAEAAQDAGVEVVKFEDRE